MYKLMPTVIFPALLLGLLLAGNRVHAQDVIADPGLDWLEKGLEQEARQRGALAFYTIELVERAGAVNVESRTGNRLVGSATYIVYLRGSLVGRNRYQVTVRVRGEVYPSDGTYTCNILGSTVPSKVKQ